jgi:hypothetical protein
MHTDRESPLRAWLGYLIETAIEMLDQLDAPVEDLEEEQDDDSEMA